MIKEAIATAATRDEAIQKAKAALNAPIDAEVKFEIIQDAQKKVFGLFGGKDAIIKARVRTKQEFAAGMEYAVKQKRAIHEAMQNGIMVMTGGPGTGKSSFMKFVAKSALEKGIKTEIFPCSSDPDSLDAVIFPNKKIVIILNVITIFLFCIISFVILSFVFSFVLQYSLVSCPLLLRTF